MVKRPVQIQQRPRRATEAAQVAAARDIAMEAVARPVRQAGDIGQRVAMAKRIVRFGAHVLVHMVGIDQAARFFSSVTGELQAATTRSESP